MQKNRLEAFSDGVLAIILTIMVLEMKVPKGASFEDLLPVLSIYPKVACTIFIFVAIMWLIPDKNVEKIIQQILA